MKEIYTVLKNSKLDEIKLLDNKILHFIKENKTPLNEYFELFLFKNAKRLRPLFIFLICDFLNIKIDDEIINLACAIELLHSASLIHDDILDNGEIRRSTVCLHKKYGDKIAVLAGDYLLSLAIKAADFKILPILANAANIMAKTEIDNLFKRFKKPLLEEYINYSKEKTSTLFIAGVKSVFKLKNLKEDNNILNFTEQFSLCFQLKDDINNYIKNDKNKLSKDMEAGIYTLPCILAEQNNFEHGIISKCKEFLNTEIKKTVSALEDFTNSEAKENLIKLSNLLNEGII